MDHCVRQKVHRLSIPWPWLLPLPEHRRQVCGKGKGVDAEPVRVHERIGNCIQRLRAGLESLEGRRDIPALPNIALQAVNNQL